jgi:histidinol-phosphate aminotransferase
VDESSHHRPALSGLVPYEPGKPIEEVRRELGLERVVKLASNEGPYEPLPAALEAIARTAHELNRYPDGGAFRLRHAIAERHGVAFEQVAVGSGADGLVDCISQVLLDPGHEIVCGWPSFPSYVIYAVKMGARATKVPLHDHRYDLEAMLAATTPRTKVAYICHPNNPTGTMNVRAELDEWFERVPPHVLTVVDQAYFEYVDDPEYVDAIEYVRAGRRALVLRTFSKIFGLAGLRVGYAVTNEELVRALSKTRRAFDVTTTGQEAAVASLAAPGLEAELRRRRELNVEGRRLLAEELVAQGLQPVPAVANFLYVDIAEDSLPLFEALLAEGVVVRPLVGFGAPGAVRVTVGTPPENLFFGEALARVLSGAPAA